MNDNPFVRADVADSARAARESIEAKLATRPRVDANGSAIDPPVAYEYDTYGRMVGKANPTAEPPS
jgi:hypothetical protein